MKNPLSNLRPILAGLFSTGNNRVVPKPGGGALPVTHPIFGGVAHIIPQRGTEQGGKIAPSVHNNIAHPVVNPYGGNQ